MASGNVEEILSETERQYPCLYDKSKIGHHDFQELEFLKLS